MNASSSPQPEPIRPTRIPLNKRRLNKPSMYKQVFEGGRAIRSAPLTLRWFRVDRECSRCGFILRKKVGDAPMRNSIRRTLRQSFVDALPRLPEGTWIVFDVANSASQGTRGSLRDQAAKLLSAIPASAGTAGAPQAKS